MTAGERTLLYDFLYAPAPGAARGVEAGSPGQAAAVNLTRLSRYMRAP
jgi:hypothetical protein